MVLKNDWSNKALREQMAAVQKELEKLAEVITTQAVQNTRIDNLILQMSQIDRRVEDLRKGDGYIRKRD